MMMMRRMRAIKFMPKNSDHVNVKLLSSLYGASLGFRPMAFPRQSQVRLNFLELQRRNDDKSEKKKYILSMFPYPSGNLHMGHVRVYTISDVLARVFRMQNYNVIHPMGWDAFGLPAENAAIERNISPSEWTFSNIEHMKKQILSLDYQFDWDREVATCLPDYYKWTQWLFIQLFKNKLAYREEATVNWDPIDQTVLANEQVDSQGRCWRSGALVERKNLKQWFLKIREFAEDLVQNLDNLNGWPEQVKHLQRKWIGRSEGAEFFFKIDGYDLDLKVFTTRPDTIFGVTYIAIAPERSDLQKLIPQERRKDVVAFVDQVKSLTSVKRTETSTTSKEGVYSGLDAIHPFTGEKIPIYIADYVIADFAEGCVMGVPAHDGRDFDFAQTHQLPIRIVIEPNSANNSDSQEGSPYTKKDGKLINSGQFNGLSVNDAMKDIAQFAEKEGFGKKSIQYKLKDWLISRQRYWGAPIPIIHCPKCGPIPVPEQDLPVKLPEGIELSGKGGSPLSKIEEWIHVKCPCGKNVDCKRETDTIDTFVDSSWYFLRYIDSKNEKEIFSKEKAHEFMNVDNYIGGIEHACQHLLYARFIYKFFHSKGYVKENEPFEKLITQGMVLGEAFKDGETNKYFKREEVEKQKDGTIIVKETGKIIQSVMEKMSKSKYNGVDPEQMVKMYGSDVVRLYMLFKAPVEKELELEFEQISGQKRMLSKIEKIVNDIRCDVPFRAEGVNLERLSNHEKQLLMNTNNFIQNIVESVTEHQSFNVCISEFHKYANMLHESYEELHGSNIYIVSLLNMIILITPFAPRFASLMWGILKGKGGEFDNLPSDVHEMQYPKPFNDLNFLNTDDNVKLVVQIKGRTKTVVTMPGQYCKHEDKVRQFAEQNTAVKSLIAGKELQKVIVANGGKLINFVFK